MSTQWRRAGTSGVATGLDYGVLPAVLSMHGIRKKLWPEILSDIQTLEAAALAHFAKKK